MKRMILIFLLLACIFTCGAGSIADIGAKSAITVAELADVEDFFKNEVDLADTEGHAWLKKMANARHRHRKRPALRKFKLLMQRARDGEINIGRGRKLRMKRIKNLTRLNRKWTNEIIIDCARGLRCPLDLHLYADDFGGSEDID